MEKPSKIEFYQPWQTFLEVKKLKNKQFDEIQLIYLERESSSILKFQLIFHIQAIIKFEFKFLLIVSTMITHNSGLSQSLSDNLHAICSFHKNIISFTAILSLVCFH